MPAPPSYPRPAGLHPPLASPEYRSTLLRAPARPLVVAPQNLTEVTGPLLGADLIGPGDNDLTRSAGEPGGVVGDAVGQRIVVRGRILDGTGRPVPHTLVEVWQANAAGRYRHSRDSWPAPLDPHFTGAGRVLTDADGNYEFLTIRPGIYPWGNHDNAWRPAHIHFSLFGRAFTQRLVTQMYFPDDPMFAYDPIFNSIPDPAARQRLVSRFDLAGTAPNWALGYTFDIVLRGPAATPMEEPHED